MTDDDERKHRWFEAITRTVGDGIYQLDTDGRFVRVNQTVADVTGYSREELIGESASLVLTDESYRRTTEKILELLESDADVAVQEMTVLTAAGEELPVENRLALLWDDGELQGSAGIVRDISDRKRRERQLQEQRDELARLDRINGIIRDTIRTLVSASNHEEIAETVCGRLAASKAYLAAWIGDYRPAGREVVPRAHAGIDAATIERHVATSDGGALGEFEESPFRTREVAVADVPADDPIREALGGGADLAVMAIPLVYGETVYSVLYVYTDSATGFGDGEVEVLQELGETIGLAVNALETKRLLDADTVTELEFEFDDPSLFSVVATDRLDCSLALEGVTSGADGELLVYVSVSGADPERVVELATDHEAVADATLVAKDDGGLLLLTVVGRTPLTAIREVGGRIERATVEDGVGRLVVAVAAGADTRRAVELFQQVVPDARLVSQQEVERSVQTPRAFRRQVHDGLTEKQRRVLEAAYYGNYFARPRAITGTELAASLDITPSTFHQHLQTGLGKVLAAVFERGPAREW